MNLNWATVAAIFTLIGLAGCVHGPRDPNFGQVHAFTRHGSEPGARLEMAQAVAIAKAEAQRRGIDLRRYREPYVSYDDGVWFTSFDASGPSPALGDHFMISVDERTDTTFYSAGR